MTNAEDILKKFRLAKQRKTLWMETYEEAFEYFCPQRENFDDELPGTRRDGAQRVFDSTGQLALQKFASNLQASLVPPGKRWIELEPGFGIPNNKQNTEALQDVTGIMFSGIQSSNFDVQVSESFLDLGIGVGALICRQGTPSDPFEFTAIPLKDLYLEEGKDGKVGSSYRYFSLDYDQIPLTWPDADIPAEIDSEYNRTRKRQSVKLIECSSYDTKEKLYVYTVVMEKEKHVILERKSRANPFIIFRWATLPGEVYGRGPALTALPDNKTLNKTKELLLQSASVNTFGMYTLDSNSGLNVENIRFGPAAIIEGAEGLNGPPIKPLPSSGRVDLTQIIMSDLRQAINDALFAEPLGPIDLPVKTATEISLRQQDLAKRIGSAFGRLQFEFIAPLVRRLLDILDSLGMIDIGPLVQGNAINVRHVSPLAMAQDEEDVIRHLRFAETIIGLFGPELSLGLIDPIEFSNILADKLNVSAKVRITPDQLDQLVQGVISNATPQALVPGAI